MSDEADRTETTYVCTDRVISFVSREYDDEGATLCILDSKNSTFYRFNLSVDNLIRLMAEMSNELLRLRHKYYATRENDG